MSDSLMKRTPLPDDIQVPESNLIESLSKEEQTFCRDNSIWTLTMDTQILEWVTQQAEDWWTSQRSHVYVWGKGHWNVIGHSGRERILPTLLDQWKDVRMVTAGSYCTYAVRFDGSVASVGEGSYGRLGHTQSDNARLLRNIESLQGIHVVEVVAGVRVTTATEEGFAIALTNTGDVYSWGKSYRGRLGHPTADNQRTPKLVEALAGKDCKQIATCDYHTAMLTFNGHLYTCGAKENGKLGHGSQGSSGNLGRITRVTKFLDSDEQTDMDVRIGYEIETALVKMLIPTPNGTNKIGYNTDRFVFDPTCTSPKDIRHLKFLGLMFGVAIRTRKPLNLHLARPMWKLLAGMTITPDDLEEVDLMFIQTLYGIRDVHKSGIGEEDFSEMIPIESFEAQSMNGRFVPIIPGGSNTKLTFHNKKDYVEKSLKFRLHELDQQIAAVREGMSTMIPVPLLSLMTAKNLEQYVCGMEEIDIMMLKKVVRYRDGVDVKDQLIQWLWETLTSFTNEEKTQFLRFVSGRSRLPARVSEIPQRFQIIKWGRAVDALPTSQTCFFQIRLPEYTSQEILAEKLRYAIKHCRSIDMDNYMLRRGVTNDEYEEWDETDEEW